MFSSKTTAYGHVNVIVLFQLSTLDINECTLGTDTCDTNAKCTNTVGNFTCSCKTGFSGDGYSCSGRYFPIFCIYF